MRLLGLGLLLAGSCKGAPGDSDMEADTDTDTDTDTDADTDSDADADSGISSGDSGATGDSGGGIFDSGIQIFDSGPFSDSGGGETGALSTDTAPPLCDTAFPTAPDCDLQCAGLHLLGDGTCDDGSTFPFADFACAAFGFDGGDCLPEDTGATGPVDTDPVHDTAGAGVPGGSTADTAAGTATDTGPSPGDTATAPTGSTEPRT